MPIRYRAGWPHLCPPACLPFTDYFTACLAWLESKGTADLQGLVARWQVPDGNLAALTPNRYNHGGSDPTPSDGGNDPVDQPPEQEDNPRQPPQEQDINWDNTDEVDAAAAHDNEPAKTTWDVSW